MDLTEDTILKLAALGWNGKEDPYKFLQNNYDITHSMKRIGKTGIWNFIINWREGKIRFNVNNAAYDAITTWSGQKPIQYMINDKYGCVPIQGSAGNYYAEIIINGAIPSDFEGNYTESAYTVPLGLNDLQIFSTAADETTVIIKKNYKIIVQ